MAQRLDMHKYFLPGYGISRIVIQSAIASYCGPGSIARPYVFQGRDGFLITTTGRSLTQSQIASLKAESLRYEEQLAEKTARSENGYYINEPVEIERG